MGSIVYRLMMAFVQSPRPKLVISAECICGLLIYILVNLTPVDICHPTLSLIGYKCEKIRALVLNAHNTNLLFTFHTESHSAPHAPSTTTTLSFSTFNFLRNLFQYTHPANTMTDTIHSILTMTTAMISISTNANTL